MNTESCATCQTSKAVFACGICNDGICKSCTQFLETNEFSFLKKVPEHLTHSHYCTVCFDQKVAGPLQAYKAMKKRAKDVFVFFDHQGKITRLMSRSEHPIKVTDGEDRDETLLKLAFQAAQLNFNAVVDIDLGSEKIRIDGYQHSKWHATGIPTNVDAARYNRK